MASERQIRVGGVAIGGGAPVVVQSMTLTKTYGGDATMAQIADLPSAGWGRGRPGVPCVVQSSPRTKTYDVDATMAQIADLASAGCEIVRLAVPKSEDADALKKLLYLSPVPLIAAIHFNASLALKAIDAGVAAVRINPGNIGGPEKVASVV